jgi:glycosyltransferase involved in cell wall biosynthesis
MIVGVDASAAVKAQRTGTESYASEIIQAILSIDKVNEYRLYSRLPPPGDIDIHGLNARWQVMPFRAGWTLFRLSWEMVRKPPDILFVPSNRLPIIVPRRSVVMVHDLSYRHVPDVYTVAQRAYHWNAVVWAKTFATHILSPSEFTTQALHEEFGIQLERITTIYHGCSISAEDLSLARAQQRPISVPYFYYIGRLEQKKNILRMLRAFSSFKNKTGSNFKLVLTGKPGLGYPEIMEAHEALGRTKEDVIFSGYLSKAEAIRYMHHALAFVFVSLFEGFGMPLLEAFALEVPVIAADATCLPEIAGGAALLVDPYNDADIENAMLRIASEQALRDTLIEKGTARVKDFSWERAARQTISVLDRLAGMRT